MDNCYMKLGAVKAKEIDGELYISCWNFSKALGEKLKLKNALCEEEPLPFSDEQYEEEPKAELPTMPIDVASMLINAKIEYPTISLLKALGAGETSFADKYSRGDLREIAEHLLVYCNNSNEEDDDTQS